MAAHMGEDVPTRLLRYFFYLLYQPFAWSYDLVAWIVSLGQWKQWVCTTLPYLTGPHVLELGHGPGHLQAELRSRQIHAFGLDRSPQMGRIASQRLLRAGLVPNLSRGSALQLPFQAARFAQVVATFPSEYIYQRETLAEIRRVLQPAGQLIVVPVAWLRSRTLWGNFASWLYRTTGQAAPWDGSFSDRLRQAGFSVEEKLITLSRSEVMLLRCIRE